MQYTKFSQILNLTGVKQIEIPGLGKVDIFKDKDSIFIDGNGFTVRKADGKFEVYVKDGTLLDSVKDFVEGKAIHFLNQEIRFEREKFLLNFLRQYQYDVSLKQEVLANKEVIVYSDGKKEIYIYRRLNGKFDFYEYLLV